MLSSVHPLRHTKYHSQAHQWAERRQGEEESWGEGEDESWQWLPGQLQCGSGLRYLILFHIWFQWLPLTQQISFEFQISSFYISVENDCCVAPSLPPGLKSQSKRALSTPPRPPSRRGRVMSDKLTASSGVDPSAKTISVPVFHLYHKLLPGTTYSIHMQSGSRNCRC